MLGQGPVQRMAGGKTASRPTDQAIHRDTPPEDVSAVTAGLLARGSLRLSFVFPVRAPVTSNRTAARRLQLRGQPRPCRHRLTGFPLSSRLHTTCRKQKDRDAYIWRHGLAIRQARYGGGLNPTRIAGTTQADKVSSPVRMASPIAAVPTVFMPAETMSPVRKPLSRALAIAASIMSASRPMSNE